MSTTLYKICPVLPRAWRLAALTPFLGASGAWIDTVALRGEFRPVISSYHALCAQNRRDWRCARLRELTARTELAKIEKAPVTRGPRDVL